MTVPFSHDSPMPPASAAQVVPVPGPDQPLLMMEGIGKRFAGVRVLEGVDFELRPGEVHVLAGENGAGKSTLIKILAGVHSEYQGRVRLGLPCGRCGSTLPSRLTARAWR